MAAGIITTTQRSLPWRRWIGVGLGGAAILGITALTLSANIAKPVVPAQAGPVVKPVVAQAQAVPVAQSKLALRAAGIVKRVAVEQGSTVQAGDVLIELDAADVALKIDEARVNVALQKVLLAQFIFRRLTGFKWLHLEN